MADDLPPVLIRLLAPGAPPADDEPWADFVRLYSKLLLHVSRSFGGGHDAAMDRYAYLLEHLRHDDYRRLRTFVADGRSEFSTWLVIVTQRLCLDHHRHLYGRPRPLLNNRTDHEDEWETRRRLIDLVSAEIDVATLHDGEATDPESAFCASEAHRALAAALGRLPPQDQLLIRLRFQDELPMREVAKALGLPTRFHGYRRLALVLAALRRELESVGPPATAVESARVQGLSVSPVWYERQRHDDL
jgi:RNA polymerase sigma factor (sigma-70 family)